MPASKHCRAKRLTIRSDPPIPVLADGIAVAPGQITALVHPRALAIMGGKTNTAIGESTLLKRWLLTANKYPPDNEVYCSQINPPSGLDKTSPADGCGWGGFDIR